jgi:hypothetical protein
MDDNQSRIRNVIERAKAKVRGTIASDLRILREMYRTKSMQEKQVLKDWITEVSEIAIKGAGLRPRAVVLVEFVQPDTDVDVLAVTISANAAKRAFECWDRDEEYLPSLSEFCGEDLLH